MIRALDVQGKDCFRSALILQRRTQESYHRPNWSRLVSKASFLDEGPDDLPPLKFATGHQGREAERLTRFIWARVVCLLEHGEEREANSLLEEFDEPPLWDDILN